MYKVGDYVRTECGIAKIKTFETKNKEVINLDKNIMFCNMDVYRNCCTINQVIKSSPNIIDLIEVGDIIICDNKKYAINYEFEVDYNNDYKDYEITIDDYITLFLKDGLSIVTKEQFKALEYEVKK